MNIPHLKIGNIVAKIPIVQGGMGVRVSLSSLASAVANEGAIGTISSLGLGDFQDNKKEFERISNNALIVEIRKARKLTNGILAVNVMGAACNSDELVRIAVREGIKIIVYGAGLPLKLPKLVQAPDVNLVPIISSARAAELILRIWDKHYSRTVDAFVIEGPLAGGHLGFTEEQLEHPEKYSIQKLLPEVLKTIAAYENKFKRKIPVIVAGGIYTGSDIAEMLSLGASGVQMGTRFVCTNECGVPPEFKQAYLDAKEEDVTIVKSPVGMPGRAIRNQFLKDLQAGKKLKIKCPYQCLTACKVKTARFCIAEKLLNSYFGDVEHGLIFCGQNVHRVNKIVSVKELIGELVDELAAHSPRFPGMIESALEHESQRSSSLITPRLSMKSVRIGS
ncbi:MAG: nitronate monooxygenase [Calditrichaeota bacterium]|nr:nitronate monooxygenase [Calditrichota bacterium]